MVGGPPVDDILAGELDLESNLATLGLIDEDDGAELSSLPILEEPADETEDIEDVEESEFGERFVIFLDTLSPLFFLCFSPML